MLGAIIRRCPEHWYVQHAVVSRRCLLPRHPKRPGWLAAPALLAGLFSRSVRPAAASACARDACAETRCVIHLRIILLLQVHAREAGIRAVVFNSRGTSDSPVSTAQFYSASFTDDMRCVDLRGFGCWLMQQCCMWVLLALNRAWLFPGARWKRRLCMQALYASCCVVWPPPPSSAHPQRPARSNVVAHVRNRYPCSLLFAAGWSLGANIMTRYLGGFLRLDAK